MDNYYNQFIKADEKLSHLTDEQIRSLIDRYYAGESTKKLIKEYNIRATTTNLYKLFPPIINEDIICPYCNIPMLTYWQPRTGYSTCGIPRCPICKHEHDSRCSCKKCSLAREEKLKQEIKEMQEIISDYYKLEKNIPIEVKDLSFFDIVYVGTLLRYGMTEDYTMIKYQNSRNVLMTPSDEYVFDIIRELYHKDIIKVHPNSPIDAFKTGKDFPSIFYLDRVIFNLNLISNLDRKEMINELMNPGVTLEIPLFEALELWKLIAFDECLDYLIRSMKKVGFEFSPGEKTRDTIMDLFSNFSVSEIYSIIYNSISKATRYYQEGNVSKRQAANSVITNCRKYAERGIAENWSIKGFRRSLEYPQSIISEFYFNRILRIGEKGFFEKPNIQTISEISFIPVQKNMGKDLKRTDNVNSSGGNDKVLQYKVSFQIEGEFNNGLPKEGVTHAKGKDVAEAMEAAIRKIANVYEVTLDHIKIRNIEIYDKELFN